MGRPIPRRTRKYSAVPKDEVSGSASDAKVPEFIEFIVKDMPSHQTPMRGGLRWLDIHASKRFGKSFKTCSAEERISIVDEIAYPAITRLNVTASGSSGYLFTNQYNNTVNPTIYAISGTTIAFNLDVPGHPFLIQTTGGANSNLGLIHVDIDGTEGIGGAAQGKTSGTVYWQIPVNVTGNYKYQCAAHTVMNGIITIKDISAI